MNLPRVQKTVLASFVLLIAYPLGYVVASADVGSIGVLGVVLYLGGFVGLLINPVLIMAHILLAIYRAFNKSPLAKSHVVSGLLICVFESLYFVGLNNGIFLAA